MLVHVCCTGIYMRHSPQLVINGLAQDCGISIDNALGAVSVYRCYYTNTGIPIIKIRRPHARLYNGSQLETASLNCIRGPPPYKKMSFYNHSNENPYTGSLRNSLVDRCPRPAKTASVQRNTCLCWSERPAISSVFFKFTLPKYCSKHISKFKTV